MNKLSKLLVACAGLLSCSIAFADIAYLAVSDDYWQVWTMENDGSDQQQITHTLYDKTRISWFPDESHLLINGNDGLIRIVDTKNGSEQAVELSLSGMLDAVIDPSGQQLAFSLSTSGSLSDNNIWIVDVDGNNLHKLTKLARMQHEPSWSWNGDLIYFVSGDGGQAHDIWQVKVATGEAEQLTVGSLYHFDVAHGPGGRLVFSSNRSGNYELWVGLPGKSAKQITNHAALDARPTWSPDGDDIVFESSRNGGLNIWQLNLQSKELTQLTHHPKGARQPTWSRPAGRRQTAGHSPAARRGPVAEHSSTVQHSPTVESNQIVERSSTAKSKLFSKDSQ